MTAQHPADPHGAPTPPPPYLRPSLPPPPLPDGAPPPPPYRPRRRHPGRGWFTVAVLLLIAAVGAATLTVSNYSRSRTAEATALQYFQDVQHGRAAQALALVAVRPTAATAPYLTSQVLGDQLAAATLADLAAHREAAAGQNARVRVTYTLHFTDGTSTPVSDDVSLVRSHGHWRLAAAGARLHLSSGASSSDRLSFAGRPLPTDTVTVFPGAAPLESDTPAVRPAGHAVARFDASDPESVSAQLTPASRATVIAALQAKFEACLAATSTDPLCPSVSTGRPVPGTLHGNLDTPLSAAASKATVLLFGGGRVQVDATARVSATWQSWDFENQQHANSETTTLDVSASTSVTALTTLYWSEQAGS